MSTKNNQRERVRESKYKVRINRGEGDDRGTYSWPLARERTVWQRNVGESSGEGSQGPNLGGEVDGGKREGGERKGPK